MLYILTYFRSFVLPNSIDHTKINHLSELSSNQEFLTNFFRVLYFIHSVRESFCKDKFVKTYYLNYRGAKYLTLFKKNIKEFYQKDFENPTLLLDFLLSCNPNALKKLKFKDMNGNLLSPLEIQFIYLEINILFLSQFIKNLDRMRFEVNLYEELHWFF